MGIACRVTGLGPLFDLGRWDELLVEATHVIERSSEVGGSYDIPLTLPWQLQVQLWRGERDRARELSEDLVEVARRIRDPQVLVPAFAAVALVAIHDGDGARAMSLVAQLEEIPEVSIDWYREQAIADLVRVCALAGDRDAAARLLDRATPVTRRHRLGLQTAQAVVAEAFGDLDDAAGRYDEVAAAWSEYGSLPETGHALLGAGRARSRLGDPSTRERLRNARAIFERLGATALVAETDRVLADSVGLAP
jgi:hypothetical protein